MKKTNAMRLLDARKIDYKAYSYEIEDDNIDGLSVARKLGRKPEEVYKTLVCQADSGEYYVFLLPVDGELDLKLAARSVGEKSLGLIKPSQLKKITGYVRGGCSPLAMKKDFKTVLSQEAREQDEIIFSAGQIGSQIQMKLEDLAKLIDLDFANIRLK